METETIIYEISLAESIREKQKMEQDAHSLRFWGWAKKCVITCAFSPLQMCYFLLIDS